MKPIRLIIGILLPVLYTQFLLADVTNGKSFYRHKREFQYPLRPEEVTDLHHAIRLDDTLSAVERLASIKYFLLGGNTDLAKLRLLHASYKNDFSRPIQLRYLAIVSFIEGKYAESLEYLNKPELAQFEYLKKVCLLKSMNLVILDKTRELETFWPQCREATLGHTTSLHLWIETLISLRIKENRDAVQAPFKNLAIENNSGDFLRIYLKLALYLNQQQVIFPRLPYMSIEVFKNDELRELIGMLYYRDGQLLNTYKFIEDLDTPNSENIKGNIYLAQNKYELAYAQFKLALKAKSNSANALERIIPVAWRLRQWKDGLGYLSKYEVSSEKESEKNAITAAFLIQIGEFEKAREILLKLTQRYENGNTPEINTLLMYTYLNLKDELNLAKFAGKACEQKVGLACWMVYQMSIWEDISLTSFRDEKILSSKESLVEKFKSSFTEEPLKEAVYISQRDVEELENAEINLLPDTQETVLP